jgi:hypothetical protein
MPSPSGGTVTGDQHSLLIAVISIDGYAVIRQLDLLLVNARRLGRIYAGTHSKLPNFSLVAALSGYAT